MNLKHIKFCRLCGNPHLSEVIDLGCQTIQGFFSYKDKPEPSKRKISTKIVRCDSQKWENGCGLVQNSVIVPPEILYSNYGYLSSVSVTMTNHLNSLNQKIQEIKGNLVGETVCDIGCNDGTFLSFYGPEVKKIGVDPSDVAKSVTGDIKIISDCFPSRKLDKYIQDTPDIKVSVFSAFACLYDVFDIESTLRSIKKNLSNDGIFVFEVAYLPTVIKNLGFDGMVLEHISLFSLSTLEHAINKAGLKSFRAEKTSTNSGSLLVFVCKNDCDVFDTTENLENLHKLRLEEFDAELDEEKTYEDFREKVSQLSRDLRTKLCNLKASGKKIHILGASTKLNTVLSYVDIGPDLIDCAAERDPRKWGGRLLSGIPMVSEEESRKTVDVYLVGPYHFFREILHREQDSILNKNIELLFPLPKILLINKDNYSQYANH